MKEIIEIENQKLDGSLPILKLNASMEDIEKAVKVELDKPQYNSVVTMDNFKDMKQSSQLLGKVAKQISDFRIAKVREETKGIKQFEDSLKSFTNMFKEKQETIKSGLNIFEEQTRQKVNAVCKEYFNSFADEVELRQEFRNVNLDDMTQAGFATATFKISAKGKAEVESRVNIQLTLQTKVDNRLLNLENECLRAGIEPLTQQHIQGFLYSSDEDYKVQLTNLINSEVKRNEAIKLREKAKAESEAKEKLLAEQQILKAELHARYESLIKTADMPNLTRINLELKSYDDSATYELRQLSKQRESELLNPVEEEPTQEEQHLKDIIREPIKKDTPFDELKDGEVRKSVTVTFDVVVPVAFGDKVQTIYEKRFIDNIKNVENMKVEVR